MKSSGPVDGVQTVAKINSLLVMHDIFMDVDWIRPTSEIVLKNI